MNIPELSVRRPVATAMIAIALAVLGLLSVSRMELSLLPKMERPSLTVITSLGGYNADSIERTVTRPLEEAVGGIGGIKSLKSWSEEGKSTITLELNHDSDIDVVRLEIGEKMKSVARNFPNDTRGPFIHRHDPDAAPAAVLSMAGPDLAELEPLAEKRIIPRLKRLEGVGDVEFTGTTGNEVHVKVDRGLASLMGADMNSLVRDISSSSASVPAGETGDSRTTTIRVPANYVNPLDVNDAMVWTPAGDGNSLPLGRLAEISVGPADGESIARVNGMELAALYVMKTGDANAVAVARKVRDSMEELKKTLPGGVELSLIFDQAEPVEKKLDEILNKGFLGALLAAAVLLLFLRSIRSTILLFISIPLSVLISFNIMYWWGITINVISLSGIALGLGMLVDNGIVVLEAISGRKISKNIIHSAANTDNHSMELSTSKKAVVSGASEVSLAILAATLTTVAVFWPLVYVDEEIKLMYMDLVVAVTASLSASWLVSVTVLPAFAGKSRTVRKSKADEKFNTDCASETSAVKPGFIERISRKIRRTSSRIGGSINSFCRAITRFLLRKSALQLIAFAALIGAGTYYWLGLGSTYLVMSDVDSFTLYVELASGTRLQVTDDTVRQIERVLYQIPDVDRVMSKINPWSAELTVKLVGADKRTMTIDEMLEKYKPDIDAIPLSQVFFASAASAGVVGDEVQIAVRGWDDKERMTLARRLSRSISEVKTEGGRSFFSDVAVRARAGRREYLIIPDREKLAAMNISVRDLAYSVRTQLTGPMVTWLIRPEKDIPVRITLDEEYISMLDDLKYMPIGTRRGTVVSLGSVAEFRFAEGPVRIQRENGQRVTYVSARFTGDNLTQAIQNAERAISTVKVEPGMEISFGGTYEQMNRTSSQMKLAVALTVSFVFMILAGLYESLSLPLLVMITVPGSAAVVAIAMHFAGWVTDLSVYIGLIILVGIVVNNAIVLVDALNKAVYSGATPGAAAFYAVRRRIRPILMTTLTTFAGMIPLITGSEAGDEIWSRMAWVLCIGLAGSTFVSLLIIPSIYVVFAKCTRKVKSAFAFEGNVSGKLIKNGGIAILLFFTIFMSNANAGEPYRRSNTGKDWEGESIWSSPISVAEDPFHYSDEKVIKYTVQNRGSGALFETVPITHWIYDWIDELAVQSGISGWEDGFFMNDQSATWYELALIFLRITTLENTQDMYITLSRELMPKLHIAERVVAELGDTLGAFGMDCSDVLYRIDVIRERGPIQEDEEKAALDDPFAIYRNYSPNPGHLRGTLTRYQSHMKKARQKAFRKDSNILKNILTDPLPDNHRAFEILEAKGSVILLEATGAAINAKNGTVPVPGDHLRISPGSAAKILVDTMEIWLSGDAELTFGDYEPDLSFLRGRARVISGDGIVKLAGADVHVKGDIDITRIAGRVYKLVAIEGMALVKSHISGKVRILKEGQRITVAPQIEGREAVTTLLDPHIIFWEYLF